MKKFLFCGFLLSHSFTGTGQSVITGHLNTKAGAPIAGASITITAPGINNLLAYDISNQEGFFSVKAHNKTGNLQITIRALGYKTVVDTLVNKTQRLHYVLEEKITELKEVIVKSNPITQRGDTISYWVKSFANQGDITIADVLRKMPGIEVLDDGKILYQGKPINKYYIEGLDLMEGKYNLINANLPYYEVTRVQVLENHQPIRILDSLVYSEQAAINLELKSNYTITGQALAGAGVSPLLWEVNLTPMLLAKNRQILGSYQTNNTGNNVARQLTTLTFEELAEKYEFDDQKKDWLAIQPLEIPPIKETRWLDNNVHLVSGNYLQRLKNDYEVRLNFSYLNDYQQQNGYTNTLFFTVDDTVSLSELKYNQLYDNTLGANLTIQKNTPARYLKNSLQFQGFWDSQKGVVEQVDSYISQSLDNKYFKLLNNFKTLFPLGKQLVTLKSYFRYNNIPQSLAVTPGQFIDILNNGSPYDKVVQNINHNTFYTHNYFGFTKGWKRFSFSPKAGFLIEKQNLTSAIFTSASTQSPNTNNLSWAHSRVYASLQAQYNHEKWHINLAAPVNFRYYQIADTALRKSQVLNRTTFEPRLSIIYDITSFLKIITTANLSNQFGTIRQVYYNYILHNYRDIQRIDAPLPEWLYTTFLLSLVYRNPVKSLFLNFDYRQTTTPQNLLYIHQVANNGATEIQAIAQDNIRLRHNFTAKASKYFYNIGTLISLSGKFSLLKYQQILNAELTNIELQDIAFGGKADTDITKWLNAKLNAVIQFSNNKIQNQNNRTINRQFYTFNLNVYPNNNQHIRARAELIKNKLFSGNTEIFFADIIYRYTLKKFNIDFELQWNNIFSTSAYQTINVDDYSYVETSFALRPAQLLLMIRFSL